MQKISMLKDKDKKSLSLAMETLMKYNQDFMEHKNKKVPTASNLPLPLQ